MTRKRYKKLMRAYITDLTIELNSVLKRHDIKVARIMLDDSYLKEQIKLYNTYNEMLLSNLNYVIETVNSQLMKGKYQ